MNSFLRNFSAQSWRLINIFLKSSLLLCSLILCEKSVAQTNLTMSGTTANWNIPANWTSSNFPDDINENAILALNARPTVTASITIGSLTGNGDNTITVNSPATLTLGASGNSKNLIMNGNNPNIIVRSGATLIIWGNATFANKVSWTIEANATVIIKGNLTMSQGTSMNVNGSLKVEGNLASGNNSDMTINGSGSVLISHDVSVSSGNLNGSGIFQFGGNCTGPTNSYCNSSHYNSSLPVQILFFNAVAAFGTEVKLNWATASELNFDYFNIQRSQDGRKFETIAEVKGHGTTKERHDYNYTDTFPIAGTSYYRLQSIDFDHYTETFNVVAVDSRVSKSIALSPVPVVNSDLSFQLNFVPKAEIAVSILTTTGVERFRGLIKANETQASMKLSLEAGVYIVKMNSIDFSKVSRIVVQ